MLPYFFDGVDIDSGHPGAATLARRASPVAPTQPTTSAVAVAGGRRGGIDGCVSDPARVRAAALAAARTAAVAAAKRVIQSAQRQAFADRAAALAVGVADTPVAAPTTIGGAVGQEDTAAFPTSFVEGRSSSRPPPPLIPPSSRRVSGRRGPGILPPRARITIQHANVASSRQAVGEARLPPTQTPRPRSPTPRPENVRASVFARAISERLQPLVANEIKAAVGSSTPLETIRESDAGLSGLSLEDFSSNPARLHSERAAAEQKSKEEDGEGFRCRYAQGLTTRFGDGSFVAHPDRCLPPPCPPPRAPNTYVETPGDGYGAGDGFGSRGGGGGHQPPSVARTNADSTASVRTLREAAAENFSVGSRPAPAKFPSSRKPASPPFSQGAGRRGRERAPQLLSPKEGKVTEASALNATACSWYCEGPAGQQVRAGRGEGGKADVVVPSLPRRCAQQVTLGYAHGRMVSTGYHPHGHFGKGDGQVVATAAAVAAAAATAGPTACTGTVALGFDEGGKRSGFPQRVGGKRSAKNPSSVVRRGETVSVAAAAAPASNRNRQRPQNTPHSLASRWPTAGTPSSHGGDNAGRGSRSVRGGGGRELEVQRPGKARRGKRRKKKGGHHQNHQHQHPLHLDDHRPNHHDQNHQHFHHCHRHYHHHEQHRGHGRGIHGVPGETGWTRRVNAATPEYQQPNHQHHYRKHQCYQHRQHYRGNERGYRGVQGETGWRGWVNASPRLAYGRCAATIMGSRPTPGGYNAWAGGEGVRVGVN